MRIRSLILAFGLCLALGGAFAASEGAPETAEKEVVDTVQPLLRERRFEEALAYLDGRLPALETAGDRKALLAVHFFRGACRYQRAEFLPAREAWEEAVRHAEALGNVLRVRSLLGNIGLACGAMSDLDCAEDYARRALRMAEDTEDADGIMWSLTNLGSVLNNRARNSEAIALFERSLRMAEEAGNLQRMSQALNNLAMTMQGRYEESLALHARAMEIARQMGNTSDVARSHNNSGIILRVTSRYDEALRHFHEARRLNASLGDKPALALALYNIAFVHSTLGEYDKAVPLYEETLRLQEETEQKIQTGMTRVSMAMLHLDQGKFAEAEALARRAIETYESLGAHADLARAHIQLGRALEGQGKNADAIRALEKAVALCREQARNPYALNWALIHLSALYSDQGLRKKAVETAQEALAAENAPDGRRRAHAALASAHRRARRADEAALHYREALAVVEDVRGALHEKGQRMSFLEKQLALYEDYVEFLMSREAGRGKKREAENSVEAFGASERMKARTFLEDLGAARFVREGISPELVKAKADLEARIRELRKLAETEARP